MLVDAQTVQRHSQVFFSLVLVFPLPTIPVAEVIFKDMAFRKEGAAGTIWTMHVIESCQGICVSSQDPGGWKWKACLLSGHPSLHFFLKLLI